MFLASFARFAPVVTLLAALAGCASVSVASDPLKLPAGSGQSPVVVSITANTGQIQGFTRMEVHRVPPKGSEGGQKEYFILERTAPGMARDTALFIGALPPGEYEFVSLIDMRTQQIVRLREGAGLLGTFPVQAGKPVDLGRLIVTPVNQNVVFGRSMRVTSNLALLERSSPAHAALFTGTTVTSWERPRETADRVEEYAMTSPVGADCATELPSGDVVAASRLGVVLRRNKEGRWGALRGPGIESLLCVAPADLPDAELLAVGEFGTLLRKPPQEKTLVPVATGNLPAGNLIRIAGNSKAGWYVAVQKDTDVSIYHTPELHSGVWTLVKAIDVGVNFWTGTNGFWMWGDAQGMGYAAGNGQIHLLDYASGAWTEHDTPNKDRLVALSVGPAGSMGVLTSPGGGFAGIFAGVYVSNDKARSWQAVQVPFKIKYAPVQRAWDGTMYVTGGVLSDPELYVSKDQGKTWTLAARYELGRALLPLRSGELLDFNAAQYGIFSIGKSADGGQTWRVEYSNFDRKAYESSKK